MHGSLYTSQQGTIFIWLPYLNIYIAAKEYGGLNPNTVVFEFINPVGGGVYDVSIDLFMPTSSDGLVGVSLSTETESWTIPSCIVPSDVRLKENIELIGKSPNGLNIYNFNYIGKEGLYQGVMAQDLLGTAYESAVILGETYKVDYSKLDVTFKKLK